MNTFDNAILRMDQRHLIFSLADKLNNFSFEKLSLDEISSRLDSLPKHLIIDNNHSSTDYHFFCFKNDHSPGRDAFFAFFGRKSKISLSTVNYLFCVSGSSYVDLMSRFLFIFNEFQSARFLKGKYWISPFRYIDFPDLYVFNHRCN